MMASTTKTIPLHLHPCGFIECFTAQGMHLNELLKGTGIHPHALSDAPLRGDVMISPLQQDVLIGNALALTDDPHPGLRVGKTLDWSFHGAIGGVVDCSPNLKEAWNHFYHFLRFAQPACHWHPFEHSFYVTRQHRLVEPIYDWEDSCTLEAVKRFKLEFQIALALRLCKQCGDPSVPGTGVHLHLTGPEPKTAAFFRALPCDKVLFNQPETAVSAPVEFVNNRWRPYRQHVFNTLIAHCETMHTEEGFIEDITAEVRWLIGTHYFDAPLSLAAIATKLRMTPRTLARRLSAEESSFRHIDHEVRMAFTLHHLEKSDLSIEQIASLMRFSSVSSLRRAVKNWSGQTLGEIQKQSGLSHQALLQNRSFINNAVSSSPLHKPNQNSAMRH